MEVREVVRILLCKSDRNGDRGDVVQKAKKFMDVISGSSLTMF